MKHLWKGASALVLFAAITTVCAPGCVDAEAPFFIKSAKVVMCDTDTIGVDSDDLGSGTMDVRYSCTYTAVLEMGNQLVRRGNTTKLQLETSRITVESFDVEILDVAGSPIQNADGRPAAFTFATTGFIDPATSDQPGYGLATALLVDGAAAQTLFKQGGGKIIVRVVAHGRNLGGDDISTRPWDFPIDVTVGGLCANPTDDTCIDPTKTPKDQCYRPQDNSFDCRFLEGHDCSEEAECGVFPPKP